MSILLFPVLGIIAFFLINYLGGRHIQQSYQNDLFDDEFGKSTVERAQYSISPFASLPPSLSSPSLVPFAFLLASVSNSRVF